MLQPAECELSLVYALTAGSRPLTWHACHDHQCCNYVHSIICFAGMVWGNPWLWLPSRHFTEWALRPAHNARVAIINAVYTVGGHVHRMLPIMLAESLTQNRCYLLPASS